MVKVIVFYFVVGLLLIDIVKEIKKLVDKDKFIIGVDVD